MKLHSFAVKRRQRQGGAPTSRGSVGRTRRSDVAASIRAFANEQDARKKLSTAQAKATQILNLAPCNHSWIEPNIAPRRSWRRRHTDRAFDSKAGAFEPATFRDRYEDALLTHLRAKQAGCRRSPSNVVPCPAGPSISSRRCAAALNGAYRDNKRDRPHALGRDRAINSRPSAKHRRQQMTERADHQPLAVFYPFERRSHNCRMVSANRGRIITKAVDRVITLMRYRIASRTNRSNNHLQAI
jgi:hypothetical protein